MYLLAINLYELGQFLRILLWIFLPLFVVVLLITTYIHHRRKGRAHRVVLEKEGLLLAAEPGGAFTDEVFGADREAVSGTSDMGQPDGDNLYKGLLWMKQKFEDYREQADQRIGTLKEELEQRNVAMRQLQEELEQAKEKIAGLTGKLESNMSLLMNIHKELDRSLNQEKPPAIMPEAANGGSNPGE